MTIKEQIEALILDFQQKAKHEIAHSKLEDYTLKYLKRQIHFLNGDLAKWNNAKYYALSVSDVKAVTVWSCNIKQDLLDYIAGLEGAKNYRFIRFDSLQKLYDNHGNHDNDIKDNFVYLDHNAVNFSVNYAINGAGKKQFDSYESEELCAQAEYDFLLKKASRNQNFIKIFQSRSDAMDWCKTVGRDHAGQVELQSYID